MFWTALLGIIAFVFILGIIVIIHELGHFIMAKRAGILCHEFSIGMGPILYRRKVGETMFALRLIPIGGFVAMSGEEVEQDPLAGRKYCQIELVGNVITAILVDYTLFDENKLVYSIVNADILGSKDISQALFMELCSMSYAEYRQQGEGETTDTTNKSLPVKYEVSRTALVTYNKKQVYQIAPWERNFTNKSIGQRFSAIIAGPLMNFVLALFIFLVIGVIQGYPTTNNTIVTGLIDETPAYDAGMRDGDKIVYISDTPLQLNNIAESSYYKSWEDVTKALGQMASGDIDVQKVYVYYIRDNILKEAEVKPYVALNMIGLLFVNDGSDSLLIKQLNPVFGDKKLPDKLELIGVNDVTFTSRKDALAYFNNLDGDTYIFNIKYRFENTSGVMEEDTFELESKTRNVYKQSDIDITKVQLYISNVYERDFLKTLYMPFVEVGDASMLVFRTLGLLFGDKSIGVSDLSGPVGIAHYTIQIASNGFLPLLNWMAILSVNVGLFNIFPLPALDGGRLAFIGYEAITRKKANAKVENIVHLIGFFLLMALFVFVAFNDTIRVFFGG